MLYRLLKINSSNKHKSEVHLECLFRNFYNLKFNQNFTSVSAVASCLVNVPTSTTFENVTNPGQSWTADDQCKQIYGSAASFCRVITYKNSYQFFKNISINTLFK